MTIQTQQSVAISPVEMSLGKLNDIVGGAIQFGDMPPLDRENSLIQRIVTDSRQVEQGDIFWALAGKNHDGSDFVNEAFARGATGVVVNRPTIPWAGQWAIAVPDTTLALWEYARVHRSLCQAKVVAVTGSVGKTSTREMIAAVLNTRLCGVASPYNYNNHIGLPLSLLQLNQLDDYGVFEIGASALGEVETLAQLCQPSIGVITCIGDAHLSSFGSQEAITSAKFELISQITTDGTTDGVAVLNGDDARLRRKASEFNCQKIWFGRNADCDFVASNVRCSDGQLTFTVDNTQIQLPTYSRHNLSNALAAYAIGKLFGLSNKDIATGLKQHKPQPMRCEIKKYGSITLIDDSYNASRQATQAALSLLRDYNHQGRKIVVLGDMAEQGKQAALRHCQLGQQVVTLCGADYLFACGEFATEVQQGAIVAGMKANRVQTMQCYNDIADELEKLVLPEDAILVKGCRSMKLEQLVEQFVLSTAIQLKSQSGTIKMKINAAKKAA